MMQWFLSPDADDTHCITVNGLLSGVLLGVETDDILRCNLPPVLPDPPSHVLSGPPVFLDPCVLFLDVSTHGSWTFGLISHTKSHIHALYQALSKWYFLSGN